MSEGGDGMSGYADGDRVEYVGNVVEVKGASGTIKGAGSADGRYIVEFDFGAVLDMCGSVLHAAEIEGEAEPMARKTVVMHPDGTQSTRNSANNIYTYAVEQREDMWATAKLHRQQAEAHREEKARFIAAVRAGRIAVRADSNHFDSIYLLGEGEEWWLGGDYASRNGEPLDRKAAIREWLANADRLAGIFDRDAGKAEAGPQYAYGVMRWSQSYDNAHKGMREFEGRTFPTSTFRVVLAEAAE
jgi:hypothetical protein